MGPRAGPPPQVAQPTFVAPRAYSQPPPARPQPSLAAELDAVSESGCASEGGFAKYPADIAIGSHSRASSPGAGDDAPPFFDDDLDNHLVDIAPARREVNEQGPRSAVPDRALPKKPKPIAWKQKVIQIQPDDYYLNQIKAARGL